MYKKNFFLIFFFITLSIIALARLYDNAINRDAWQYGEWLINYQHGFVRRGIAGEIIYLFSVIFNDNIQISFFVILSSIVLLYFFLNYYFIKNLKLNFINYFIIFSPLFYFLFIVVAKIGIRKETILYIFYLLYLIQLSSENFILKKNWKFILLFPLLLLNHEGSFFYLPYLILPLFFIIKKNELKELIFQACVLIVISSLLEIFLYYNKGSLEHTLTICQSLGQYAPVQCNTWGPIKSLIPHSIIQGYTFTGYKIYFGFLFYVFYGFFPLFVFFKFSSIRKNKFSIDKKKYFLMLLAAFIFSMPLFPLVQDWSRLFSTHFHLMAFTIFFLQRIKLVNYENHFVFNKINSYVINKRTKKFFLISLFLYATFLQYDVAFHDDAKLEFTYHKVFIQIKSKF